MGGRYALEALGQALSSYEGGVVLVSHNRSFLQVKSAAYVCGETCRVRGKNNQTPPVLCSS